MSASNTSDTSFLPHPAPHVTSSDAATDQTTSANDGWHVLGNVDAVFGSRACYGTTLEGVKIGLFRVNGEIHALDDICTHGAALLSDGFLEGHEIECPLHAGLVDIRTGRAMTSPITRDTRRHEVQLRDGTLLVKLNA